MNSFSKFQDVESNFIKYTGPTRGRLWRRQNEAGGVCRSCGLKFVQKKFSDKVCNSCKFSLEFTKYIDLDAFA
jgi:hypothetical protein